MLTVANVGRSNPRDVRLSQLVKANVLLSPNSISWAAHSKGQEGCGTCEMRRDPWFNIAVRSRMELKEFQVDVVAICRFSLQHDMQ